MKRSTQLGMLMCLSIAAVPQARAGFLIKQWHATPSPSSDNNYTFGWNFDRAVGLAESSFLDVYPTITQNSLATDSFSLTGTVNSDPTIEILERITNNSGNAWTAYTVKIAPDANSTLSNVAALFPPPSGTGFTTPFTSATSTPQLDGSVLLTFNGGTVNTGTQAIIDVSFDVNIVSNFPGNFGYTVTNAVAVGVPEPAAFSVILVGAVFAGRRRLRSRVQV